MLADELFHQRHGVALSRPMVFLGGGNLLGVSLLELASTVFILARKNQLSALVVLVGERLKTHQILFDLGQYLKLFGSERRLLLARRRRRCRWLARWIRTRIRGSRSRISAWLCCRGA